ncbi:MAG: DUF1444 family protein [Planctomycetales bacterium]|nr:DUF1444 family protein [Planctomycetales bacterium]
MSFTPPDHWHSYANPALWYSLWHPPTWSVEHLREIPSFVAPDGGGLLTLSAVWLDQDSLPHPRDHIKLDQMFPQRRNVREVKPLDMDQPSVAFEGETIFGIRSPWWRRILRRRKWRKWRAWCVRHDNVILLAVFLQTEVHDPESETVATMILNTLQFADVPALPTEKFAQRVLELTQRHFPLLDSSLLPDFQLKLGPSQINLFNFYRSYVAAPLRLEQIVLPALTTVVQVQGWGKSQTEPLLDDVRDRILPMLYPEHVWHERFAKFVGREWVAGLAVLYVVDESQAYWYIRDDLLDTWGMTADELHALALANLDRYFDERPMEFTVAGSDEGPRLLLPTRPDAYNSARLLSQTFHDKLEEIFGQEFAVGTPSRDFFVAVSTSNQATVDHVRQKVGEDFKQMDHPLSDRLLLVTRDGVSEYVPWE